MLVQTLVPHLAVEAFDESVLNRLARLNEMQLDASFAGPDIQRLAGELGPIVCNQDFWESAQLPEPFGFERLSCHGSSFPQAFRQNC